ncbi:MAG TPA: 2OG-Fe(II) oxygenase [Alphaproteobacteria bacterium]|jgi:PKHD-type hydroxylase
MFHYPLPNYPIAHTRLPNFVWGAGVFTPAELDKINAYAMTLPAQPVRVGLKLSYKPEVNRSVTRWLQPGPETMWMYQKFSAAVSALNAQHYQFDVTGFDEPLYHVTYPSSDLGHYDWHSDIALPNEPLRKLSITFQMTDPSEYDGGDLEMNAFGHVDKCPRDRGKLILFPSHQIHRVTPVTRGTRSALVSWVVGPPFR